MVILNSGQRLILLSTYVDHSESWKFWELTRLNCHTDREIKHFFSFLDNYVQLGMHYTNSASKATCSHWLSHWQTSTLDSVRLAAILSYTTPRHARCSSLKILHVVYSAILDCKCSTSFQTVLVELSKVVWPLSLRSGLYGMRRAYIRRSETWLWHGLILRIVFDLPPTVEKVNHAETQESIATYLCNLEPNSG